MTKSNAKYVGVDGCKTGWIGIGLCDGDGHEVKVFTKFRDLVDHYSAACLILVDMPIGLVCLADRRVCERKARKLVGSAVFSTLSRKVVYKVAKIPTSEYKRAQKEAQILNRSAKFKKETGITKQAHGIAVKIAQVDKVMTSCNTPKNVREVHPEVCFWALNGEIALSHSKKATRSRGIDERLEILKCHEVNAGEIFNYSLTDGMYDFSRDKYRKYLRKEVAKYDILDALAAAVTARLCCKHPQMERRFTGDCEKDMEDSRGLPMEMVYVSKKDLDKK